MSATKSKEKLVTNLSEYMKVVERCGGPHVLFRGQPCDKPLLPKIAREELRCRSARATAERAMLEDFKRQAVPLLEFQPMSDWDWLAVAQHHGMATRLLDWTLNPLAALWFAVERPARHKNQGVVWFFEAENSDYVDVTASPDPFVATRTKVFRHRHLARRITAQAGWFTAHRYQEANNVLPLHRNKFFKRRLTKLIVPAASFAALRKELDRCAINASTLQGGLDGLCRHVEWSHSLLEDEEAKVVNPAESPIAT